MTSWFTGLKKTRDRIASALRGVFGGAPRPAPETIEELTDLLVMADVPMALIRDLLAEWEKSSTRSEPPRDTFRRVLLSALEGSGPPDWTAMPAPAIILLTGINGSGKYEIRMYSDLSLIQMLYYSFVVSSNYSKIQSKLKSGAQYSILVTYGEDGVILITDAQKAAEFRDTIVSATEQLANQ